MTERTISPWLRWQTVFVLFHYLFSLLIFSLPAHALNPGATVPSSHEVYTEASPLRDQMAQFWGSAQQSNASDAARGVANSAVNSALTAEVESWLKLGGGKAKVTLDTGIAGSHNRDIGLDYFWPLLDSDNSTLFTQLSFHRWNERNQINVGLGYRHDLNEHWMAGGNLFYDRDLSRRHNRLGVGGELWGEGLRTSVNYYHPLSDWRLSHDNNFNDDPLFYDLYERAARGWDLSVEAALSQHVGVKGTWFQWYGDKVDVTGTRSQASRDPHGVTLGANWQPVPLLAFNAEHSVISGQEDDTRLGLNLSWQFGRTLDQMLDPDAASAMSSLKGARHDFVNRNNNIVLAYQQREKDLHLYFEPNSLTTKAGSTPFTHAVKGGRGGFIVYHSSQPDIAQIVSEQAGTVAPLKRGEVVISAEEYQDASRKKLYDRAEYRLTILPGDFAPSVTDVRIEGEPTIGGTLTGSYTFISNEGEDEGATTQRWYRQHAPEEVLSSGQQYQQTAADVGRILVYEVTPVNKAGLRGKPGSAQQAGPQLTLNNLEMTLLHGGGEQQANGTIKFKAGETGMLLFEATVLDQDGKPVANQPVYWSHNNLNLGKLDETRQTTNSKGQSLVKFSDITQGGEDIIVASLLPERGLAKTAATAENTTTKTLPLSISFSAASNVTFINPPQKVTVGTKTDFTVLVTDEENQALENTSLQITSNGDTRSVNTGKDGKATFSLVAPLSIDPAQWTVSAVLTDNSEKGDTARIDLLADSASAQLINLAATPATVVVNTPVLLTARVQDKHGNPVRGVEVTFLSTANNGVMLKKSPTDERGVALYPDYTQTVAQVFHPAAQLGAGVTKETSVTFTADKVATLTLQRNFSGELAADATRVSWTATANDAHNNPVIGAALVWKVTGPSGEITPEKDDVTNDQGDALLTITLPKTQGDLKVEVASGNAQQQDSVTLKPVLTMASLKPGSDKPVVGGQVILTAQVTNLAGEPLENVPVDFTNNQNTRMTEQRGVRTDINGLAQAALEIVKGQEQGAAGDYDVTATLSAKPTEHKTATVSWQLDNAAARVTRLSANPTSARVGSKVQLMATVNDPFGNPVSGAQVEFLSALHGDEVLTSVASNDQGIAVWADYSQTIAQVYKPAARVVGGTAQETSVTFTVDAVASLELIPNFSGDLLADGATEASWTVTAKDRFHNRVPDAALAWTVTGPGGNISPQKKDDKTQANGSGEVTIVLPKKQGAVKVEVSSGAEKTEDNVILQPVLTLKSLEADNRSPVVGGPVNMTVYVTNLAGDPMANVLVNFTNNHSAWMTEQADVKTDANGMAQAVLKIREGKELGAPGNYLVTATLQEKPSEAKQETITWLADQAEAQVTELHATPTTATAGSKVQLSATVRDRFGNPVTGMDVEFLSAASNGTLMTRIPTNDQGVALYPDYSQHVAQIYQPAARVAGGAAQETRVTFTAATVASLELTRDFTGELWADGSSARWIVTAKDTHGNRVKDAALTWTVTGPSGESITPEQEDKTSDNGEAKATITLPKTHGMLKVDVASGVKQDHDSVTLKPVLTLKSLQTSNPNPMVGAQVTMTATVTNLAGDPLENVAVDFTNNRNSQMTEMRGVKTNASGKAEATLRIITGQELGAAGHYDVTATLAEKTSETRTETLRWQVDTADAKVTELHASPTSAVVGSKVKLIATVKDSFGNPVNNASVDFLSAADNGEVLSTLSTNDQGIVTYAEYSQKVAASYYPAARVVGGLAREANVVFTHDTTSVQVINLQPEPATAVAGAKVVLKATVQDQYGNAVANTGVQFLSAASQGEVLTTLTTNGKGEVSWAEYTQTTAGEYAPAARVINGNAQATTVNFSADPVSAKVVAMKAYPVTAVAGTDVMLTATVQDQYGNLVKNGQAMVSFLVSKTGVPLGEPVTTNEIGEASFSNYQQQAAGDYYPAARVGGGAVVDTRVTYTAGAVTTLTLQPDFVGDLQADGISKVSWTVTAQDAHGNTIPDAPLTWEITGPAGNIIPTKDDKTNAQGKGLATVTLPGEQGELHAVVKSGNVQDDDRTTLLPVLRLKSLVPDTTTPQVGGSVTLTAKVVNQAGTALANVAVNFTHDRADVMEQAPDIKTDSNGEARATLKILKGKELGAPGNYVIKATLKDKTTEFKEATVTWQPGIGEVTGLTANPTSAAADTDVQLTATVQDQFGNKVQNAAVTFLSSIAGNALGEAVNSNAEGISIFKYRQSTAGSYRPAASTGNGGSKDAPVSIWGTPSIESVIVTPNGSVAAGTTLTATVQGFDAQGTGDDDSRYQWFSRQPGKDWQKINNATDKTLNTSAYYAGYDVRVVVTPRGSQQVTEGLPKESAPITLYGKPTITSVNVTPATQAQAGTLLTATHSGFDANGTGEDDSKYQWYYRRGSQDWKYIDKATEKTFTPTSSYVGLEVRAGVKPKGSQQAIEGDEKYSNEVRVFGTPSIESVSVTPESVAQAGTALTATIKGFDAQGNGQDSSTYQWYYRKGSNTDWTEVKGAAGKTFPTLVSNVGLEIRVIVTPKGSLSEVAGVPKESNVVRLYGKPTIASVTVTPKGSVRVNNPLSATYSGFNAQGTGEDASLYQWYYRPSPTADWIVIDTAKEQSYTPDNVRIGQQVRLGVTPKGRDQAVTGTEIYSDPVSVYGMPSIASVMVTPSGSVAQNEMLTAIINGFNAQGTGGNASLYQWYFRRAADQEWIKVDKAEQNTFSLANTQPGYQVRVAVTPKGSEQAITGLEIYSGPVTVLEAEPSVANVSISGDPTVTKVLTVNYSFQTNGGAVESGTIFQWYLNGEVIPGATGKTYTVLRNNPGKPVSVIVTPKNQKGMTGKSVTSLPTENVKPVELPMPDLHGADCAYVHSQKGIFRWDIANTPADLKVIIASWSWGVVYWESVDATRKYQDSMPKATFNVSMEDAYGNKTSNNTVTFENNFWQSKCIATIGAETGGTSRWPD